MLLQKVVVARHADVGVTKADIVKLDKWFEQLSVNYGKAAGGPTTWARAGTGPQPCSPIVSRMADVPMDPDRACPPATANKHFNKLGQIHSFTRKAVPIAERSTSVSSRPPIDKTKT